MMVTVQLDSVPSSTAITLNESEYNGLHWRTVKRSDTTPVPNGLDERRLMYYSAAWQMIQEDIDLSYVSSPGTNNRAQQVWGLRYIDDAVTRRTDSGANGSYESTYYYITDAQFSVVAMLNSTGVLQERVRYEAYGKARHSWPSDVDGDGDSDTTDSTTITGAYGTIGATAYNADCDINRSGTVDATDLGLWIAKGALPAGEISHLPDNSVGYDGYLFNREFQVYTVRFRHYEPVLGRWLQRDNDYYVTGTNLYEGLASSPTGAFDPVGRAPGDKKFGLPDEFWKWYHRNMKDAFDQDLTKEQADELYEEWKQFNKPGGDKWKNKRSKRPKKGPGGAGGLFLGAMIIEGVFVMDAIANQLCDEASCRDFLKAVKRAQKEGKCNSEIETAGEKCEEEILINAGDKNWAGFRAYREEIRAVCQGTRDTKK
ncbi:MAG: hypothetical protein H7Y88_05360 [Phycisphaerales bacterium]|nr:hypothetical protein [Phycisphaerales bacterium]